MMINHSYLDRRWWCSTNRRQQQWPVMIKVSPSWHWSWRSTVFSPRQYRCRTNWTGHWRLTRCWGPVRLRHDWYTWKSKMLRSISYSIQAQQTPPFHWPKQSGECRVPSTTCLCTPNFIRSHLAIDGCLSICLSNVCIVTKQKHLVKKFNYD